MEKSQAEPTFARRKLLRNIGVAAAAALAGCADGGGNGGGDGGGNGGGGQTETSPAGTSPGGTEAGTAGGTGTGTAAGTAGGQQAVDQYLSDTKNYDGSIADETGSQSVTVDVGAQGNGGAFAFEPAAIRVSTGTSVTWKWTGEGGAHTVTSEGDGPLDSGSKTAAGETYEYTFDKAGTFLYYCQPHESLGMKGAVVVE